MPFIDAKVTVSLDATRKEALKAAFGKAIPTLHKTETYLMVGIQDNCDLWMAGQKLTRGAYVSVSLYWRISWASPATASTSPTTPSATGAGMAAISEFTQQSSPSSPVSAPDRTGSFFMHSIGRGTNSAPGRRRAKAVSAPGHPSVGPILLCRITVHRPDAAAASRLSWVWHPGSG